MENPMNGNVQKKLFLTLIQEIQNLVIFRILQDLWTNLDAILKEMKLEPYSINMIQTNQEDLIISNFQKC